MRHQRLVADLDQKGVLPAGWRVAFEVTPRHVFLPDTLWGNTSRSLDRVDRATDPNRWWEMAYADEPVVTQVNDGLVPDEVSARYPTSSASRPSIVATMLDRLDVHDGQRVLEIGTGTGWNAALLAARLGDENVTTVEVDPGLADRARATLKHAGHTPVVVTADGAAGYRARSPYDRILSTAAVHAIPIPWIDQTRPGGLVVTPWGGGFCDNGLLRLTIGADGTATGGFTDDNIAFMPLRAQRHPRWAVEDQVNADAPADTSTTVVFPGAIVFDFHAHFAVGLHVPDIQQVIVDDDPYVAYFVHLPTHSWATVTVPIDDETDEFEVRQYGPRRLWDEVEAAHAWWVENGRPERDRFGLTVTPDRQWTWLDEPGRPVN